MYRLLLLASVLAVAAAHGDITEKWANKKVKQTLVNDEITYFYQIFFS